jgi:hypothetical protein
MENEFLKCKCGDEMYYNAVRNNYQCLSCGKEALCNVHDDINFCNKDPKEYSNQKMSKLYTVNKDSWNKNTDKVIKLKMIYLGKKPIN